MKTVMITSSKGGVGKTTVTAHLAMTLACMGKKVLAVDLDLDSRCLDLVAGVEDAVVYDVTDLLLGRVSPDRAILRHPQGKELYICAAPAVSQAGETEEYEAITAQVFYDRLVRYAEESGFDFLLLDTPGTPGVPFQLASSCADTALVIATQQPSAIRAAELTARRLENRGMIDCRMVINFFDSESILDGIAPGAVEMIDRTYLQLIAIIPQDQIFPDSQQDGFLLGQKRRGLPARAMYNLARRLCGENVPLFKGMRGMSRYGLKH